MGIVIGRFHTITMDPPWNERGGGGRGAQNHYPLIKTREDMLRTILTARFADGSRAFDPRLDQAHLYMWVTNNYLPDGLWLMAALGFRYVTNLVWAKTRGGIGQYMQGWHELCLFGVQGKAFKSERIESLLGKAQLPHPCIPGTKKPKHSAKPAEIFRSVERLSRGPYCEMFSRPESPRPGWRHWGNEADIEASIGLPSDRDRQLPLIG